MTKEEVIMITKSNNPLLTQHRNSTEYLVCVLEALEKQIPKKAQYSESNGYYCPVCGNYLFGRKWCCECGQAILWEVEND